MQFEHSKTAGGARSLFPITASATTTIIIIFKKTYVVNPLDAGWLGVATVIAHELDVVSLPQGGHVVARGQLCRCRWRVCGEEKGKKNSSIKKHAIITRLPAGLKKLWQRKPDPQK